MILNHFNMILESFLYDFKVILYGFYNIFYIWRWPISREALYVNIVVIDFLFYIH